MLQETYDKNKAMKKHPMDEVDKEAVESMPTARATEKFVSAIKHSGLKDKEAQKRAAKRIVKKENFSVAGIESEVFEEKYRMREKAKNEKHIHRKERDFQIRIRPLPKN